MNAYGQENTILVKGNHSAIVVPAGAKLPIIGGGATEEDVQEWSRNKYGQPIISLVDTMLEIISSIFGTTTALTDENIKALQKSLGVTADGLIGKQTMSALGFDVSNVEFDSNPISTVVAFVGGGTTSTLGGKWYQQWYTKVGGATLLLGLIGYGVYAYRNRDEF